MLANQAFATIVGKTSEALIGRSTYALEWCSADGTPLEDAGCPWHATLQDASPQRNVILWLDDGAGKLRSFLANCSPVLGARGSLQGVLISLDDGPSCGRRRSRCASLRTTRRPPIAPRAIFWPT